MDEKDKLIEYLNNGYLINGPILKISTITPHKRFLSVFPIENGAKILGNALNQEKTLIMLRKGKDTTEIVTNDEETIKIAKQKRNDQDTPIGTLINVVCELLGTNLARVKNFDLESFVHTLNENTKWDFKLNDSNSILTISIRIESMDTKIIDEHVEELQNFVDLLSAFQNIGILIHNVGKYSIPKEPSPILMQSGPIYRRV